LLSLFLLTVAGAQGQAAKRGAGNGLGTVHGLPEALEAIERARVVTRVLYVTAHPDDEPGPVLAWLARGAHADVALLSLTRGEGGQNALGPEMAPQLGLLRTEEMLAAARIYGVRVYFGGAADFGFSKSADEALRIWGEPVLANMVQVIRTFRPHIVINNWGGVTTGHGQHQAAGLLTPQAVAAAADARRFPEQIKDGRSVWRTRHVLQFARGAFGGTGGGRTTAGPEPLQLPTNDVSPLWGKPYTEIGIDGYTQHRTQGVEGVRQSAFIRRLRQFQEVKGSAFDPPDFSERLAARWKGLPAGKAIEEKLDAIEIETERAIEAAHRLEWETSAGALVNAARYATKAAAELTDATGEGVEELRWDLIRFRAKIDSALKLVTGARVVATADRGEIVPGGNFTVRVETLTRASPGVKWDAPALEGPAEWTATRQPPRERDDDGVPRFAVQVAADAKPSGAFLFGIEPWPAPVLRARLRGTIQGYSFDVVAPVTAQRATTTRLETLPLTLVPAVTLTPETRRLIVVASEARRPRELVVRVRHNATTAASVVAGLDAPEGWIVSPPTILEFAGAGDQLVRLTVTPPAQPERGQHALRLWARHAGFDYGTSLEPLPTLPTRLWSEPATVRVHVFDLNVPTGLRVGYVAAENDPIPDALRQIGVQVDLLDEGALAFGDLQPFHAIAIGIRAYELRADLARANPRLLDYAKGGGTLVVQYQRDGVWNAFKPAPYPALVSERTRPEDPNSGRRDLRTTDENSPVRLLLPGHPVLSVPNTISAADFDGWVQERGLYYWGEFDARYAPLLAMRDPGEAEVTGALVYAPVGKGHYVFTGLSFFRQLPAGVPGACRLLVNLLSVSKTKDKPRSARSARS
jgi:LmbE family N-acetylglucosaminyl deacetylase